MLHTALLLSWGISIGGCGNLLGALIGVVTLDSTFKASDLRLVFGSYGNNIASGPWGSIGVGIIVVVVLRWGTVEVVVVARVMIISSGLGVSSTTIGIGGTVPLWFVLPWNKSLG